MKEEEYDGEENSLFMAEDSGLGRTHLTACSLYGVCVCVGHWEWITGLTAHCLPQGKDCGSMT